MKKQILWIRELSCGHERATNVAFISGIYSKPKVGANAYCRECMKEVKIINVRKGTDEQINNEYNWIDKLLINVFGTIGVFGWYFVIWIPEYRWRLFFTTLLSLILAFIFVKVFKNKQNIRTRK